MKLNWILAGVFLTLLFFYIPLEIALVIKYPIKLANQHPYFQVYAHTMGTLIPGVLVLVRRAQVGCGYWASAGALLGLDTFFIWLLFAPAVSHTPWLFQGL
jgi:hypothetical protein